MNEIKDYLKQAISNKENIDSQEPTFNNTPLHIAAEESLELTRQVLQTGSATDIRNSFGETAILSPAIKGDAKTFALLTEAGANLRKTNDVNEPIRNLTSNNAIIDISKQSNALDKSYKNARKNPIKTNQEQLKESLSESNGELWNPYKRLASKIGNDANSSNQLARTNAKIIFRAISSDPLHREQMLEASEEVSKRQQNQGNKALSFLIENSKSNSQWRALFNRKTSQSHVQALQESTNSATISK